MLWGRADFFELAHPGSELEKLVAAFRQALLGRRSEKIDSNHYHLALEDIEAAMAIVHAEDDPDIADHGINGSVAQCKACAANRGALTTHLRSPRRYPSDRAPVHACK